MTEKTQSPLTDDVRDVEQAGTTQNFIVGHEVVPADVQDASLAPRYTERIQFIPKTSEVKLSRSQLGRRQHYSTVLEA